jgi:penicillin-binding protein 2
MKRGQIPYRIYFLGAIIFLAISALSFRLWYVQIARGAEYTAKVASGSRITVRIPAVRGDILDRNGIPLVQNRASFDVDFFLPDMVRAYRESHGSVPMHTFRGTVRNMQKDMSEADVRRIVADEIIPRLEELGVAQDYNADRLQIHYRLRSEVPYNYMQDMDFETMALLSERNLGVPGVTVTKKPVRQYLYGALGAHFLGYVGMPNDLNRLPDINKFNFYDPDMDGKAQIELAMNDYLKGEAGMKILQRDAKGTIIRSETEIVEPKQGANVYLTIDARIQYIVEEALRAVGRAAAVVVDPKNGDILAMASIPSYDPNKFIPAIAAKDWLALNKDETDLPLNRSVSAYARVNIQDSHCAGLRAGVGDRHFNCSGGVQYGNKYMRCWIADKGGTHGTLSLQNAIKVSCNAFFYQYGNAAGIDQIVAMGNMLGLGQKSGIPLSGEAPGVLPGPEWLAAINPQARWSSGLTANTSIGQGDVLATPLQMAMVTAAVANGGTCYYPRMIDKVVAQDGSILLQEPAKYARACCRRRHDAAMMKGPQGMNKVVNESGGTAGKARIKDVTVAGKTGTAQFWRSGVKDNHTWFLAFAPYDEPKYAICILVQGAKSGGGVAAPIAAKILEDTFALDQGKDYELAWLEPAKGNFKFVESVDFNREIPTSTAIAADEETGGDSGPSRRSQENKPAAPNVRAEADEGGKVRNKVRKPSGIEKFFNFLTGGNREKRERQKAPAGHR